MSAYEMRMSYWSSDVCSSDLALQQLKAQGFVTAVQGGGTRITAAADQLDSALARLVRANRNNLHALAEVRANLEVWAARSEERRVGNECVGKCRSRWSPSP